MVVAPRHTLASLPNIAGLTYICRNNVILTAIIGQ
ncbi:hypothetical protein HU200_047069 [Digitaria exilis]|uniref:Uncharacterized protein n=1 Tax=Digitaria exilis TaxID=1010633 RepID=A0A835AXC1_9POAL|nr:hypothetical protein HU200_047069 [Digitaria exilis]